jgi:predicted enzyme related to lactoylglutathione lyase
MDKVVHFEIPGDDMGRLKGFYTDVFGWELQDYPEMEYSIATTVPTGPDRMPSVTGAINGGLKKRDVAGEQPVIVIDVASLDDSIRRVEAAGGKVVVPKAKVGDMGWYARVKDTEGNIIGVWETIPKKA